MAELDEEFAIKQLPKSQRFRLFKISSDYHKVNGEYPQKWARRVLRKFVGKTYDEVFAYFCTLVPDYQQKYFIEELKLSQGYWTPDNKYVVDEGIIKIVVKEAKNGLIVFESYDYKIGYKNKRDGSITVPSGRWQNGDEMRYINAYPRRYTKVIVSGYTKEFESVKDREYIRLMKEKTKLKKLDEKKKKKEKEKVDYSFISFQEEQKKRD